MKKIFYFFAVSLLTTSIVAQNTDLIISTYFEGPTGNNKVLEIYNGTGVTVDLSAYSIKKEQNGVGGLVQGPLQLTGTLAHGACYIIANDQMNCDEAFRNKANIQESQNIMNFNGNDALGLFKNNTQIDQVGVVGQVTDWGKDVFMSRKCSVTSPTTTYNVADWDVENATNLYSEWAALFGTHCGTDTTAPTFTDVSILSATKILLSFNEALDATTAQNIANYTIIPALAVSGATLAETTNAVILTVASIAPATTYTVSVTGVKDLAGNAITTAQTKTFVFNPVANLEALYAAAKAELGTSRDGVLTGTTVYTLTGTVAVTAAGTQRGQMWVEDESGAIHIDDPNNKIATDLPVGSTVAGISGTVTVYYGLFEFMPVADAIPDATPAFGIQPAEIDLEDFKNNQEGLYEFQSTLAVIKNVYFKDNVALANGTDYAMCSVANGNFGDIVDSAVRTHIYNTVTYTSNKAQAVNITGVLVFSRERIYIAPRTTADIVIADIPVTGVLLYKNTVTLNVNQTEQLIDTILPGNATNINVTWRSSNTNVATVSLTGVVTAMSEGTAQIIVTTEDGGFTDTCIVTVVIPVTSVDLNKSATTLNVGQTEQLSATVLPDNATNKNVTWQSSNTNIATVSSTGLITAIGIGYAHITVTTENGGFTKTCVITVVPVPVDSVFLNKDAITLNIGETEQLSAIVLPDNATNKNVTWQSSNNNIAAVLPTGLVLAANIGATFITATTDDGGYIASCIVNVTDVASSIEYIKQADYLQVYPNPTTRKLTIDNIEGLSQIEIYNLLGLRVAVFKVTEKQVTVDLSHLFSGTYIVRAGNKIAKIVKL
ncbi:MAG: Ig-like domain-containing protein [Bacteroidales bacterium]|jgi:uncharacterized protein YjdB|nr:Ig-like domain-containing protein [Bacteroidales bacterium]